ncbi:hypothetical protein HK096_004619 [Nowakowskiella sp. JEL0078]|nr:hypothetical protein HK096_004619 [Nowakowskiella sp. JEL0078]
MHFFQAPAIVELSNSVVSSLSLTENVPDSGFQDSVADSGEFERLYSHDVMLSYCWSDKDTVQSLYNKLISLGLEVWFDETHLRSKLQQSMADGVMNCAIFVPVISTKYEKSANAMAEFRFAATQHRKFIPVRLDSGKFSNEIEFTAGPVLWMKCFDKTEVQLWEAAQYILSEVRKLNAPKRDNKEVSLDTITVTIPRISAKEVQPLSLTPIAEGGFSKVYRATYEMTDVVLKKLELTGNKNVQIRHALITEAALMLKMCFQPRIVTFYGIIDEPNTIGIVMEYMSNGSLHSRIRSSCIPLEVSSRLQILYDTVCGVKALHISGIIHQDLKSANILLDDNMRAKISDFGLARIKCTPGQPSGTEIYFAPELYTFDSPGASMETDIFAFGVIMSEILSWNGPWGIAPEIVDEDPSEIVRIFIHSQKRPEILLPMGIPESIGELLQECWAHNAIYRPNIQAVFQNFTNVLRDHFVSPRQITSGIDNISQRADLFQVFEKKAKLKITEGSWESDMVTFRLITPRECESIAVALEENKTLRQLRLWSGSIDGYYGARALAKALQLNSVLTGLSVYGNFLGDEGVRILAPALENNTTLIWISLENNKISDIGARTIATMLQKNKRLGHLYMKQNAISDPFKRLLLSVRITVQVYFE